MNLWNDPARTVDDRVEALLAAMSTQEKVFQLGSWWPMESQPQFAVLRGELDGIAEQVCEDLFDSTGIGVQDDRLVGR